MLKGKRFKFLDGFPKKERFVCLSGVDVVCCSASEWRASKSVVAGRVIGADY